MLDVDGVDFFTAILSRKTGEFICWYYTPKGSELVANLDPDNKKYALADFKPHEILASGLPEPVDYKAPVPAFNDDCEIPPYTDEQLVILNTLHGIDNLTNSIVDMPTEVVTRNGDTCVLVSQSAVIELIEKFRRDFQDGKIA